MEEELAVQPTGWHLNKSVSISHIVTTIMVAIGVISAYYNLKLEVEKLQLVQTQHEKQLDRYGDILRETSTTNANLSNLVRKIDEYIESDRAEKDRMWDAINNDG